MNVCIAEVRIEAEDIRSYRLEPVLTGSVLPRFTAGAHIDVHVKAGVVRQYSLCSDPREASHYRIGVQKDVNGTGGSAAVVDGFAVGQIIEISEPRNHFKLDETGLDFTLIAGGIGVTPILAMAQRLRLIEKPFAFHYLARSDSRFGFTQLMADAGLAGTVRRHCDERDGMPDLASMIGPNRPGQRVYCCGPAALMNAVQQLCRDWPPRSVVFERFNRDDLPSLDLASDFEIQVGKDGPVYRVGPGETVLKVLRGHGVKVDSQCERGLCGTCETGVLSGVVDHRDAVLDDAEKAANKSMTVCVSRALSKRLVLDL